MFSKHLLLSTISSVSGASQRFVTVIVCHRTDKQILRTDIYISWWLIDVGVNPRVHVGELHTLSHVTAADHRDWNKVAVVRSYCTALLQHTIYIYIDNGFLGVSIYIFI